MGEHVGNRTAVLALQAGEHREPLLDLLQAPRRALELERVRAQCGAELLGLVTERLGALGQPGKLWVDPRRHRQLRGGVREQLGRPSAPVVRRDRFGPGGRRGPQRLEIAQPISLDGQFRLLLLGRRHALDLVELEREQVELAFAAGGELAQLRLACLDPPHPRVRLPHLFAERHLGASAMGVEHVELHR